MKHILQPLTNAGYIAILSSGLVSALALSGCASQSRPDASAVQPSQAINSYALSGGKITHFIPPPGLPNDPTAKAMLKVCRQLELKSSTAQGAYAVFEAREGKFPVFILIVGNQIIASLGDVVRNHETPLRLEPNGTVILYPGSASDIVLSPQRHFAVVGKSKITLKNKALYQATDKELLMFLPDLITVFHARDIQLKGAHEINFVKVIYDIRDFQP